MDIPFIVYNVPGRTCCNVLPKTMAELKKSIPQVVGCKEATANLTQTSDIIECCGPDFMVLSGVITSYSIHYTKLYDFGEYMPLPDWIPLGKLVDSVGDFIPGRSAAPSYNFV